MKGPAFMVLGLEVAARNYSVSITLRLRQGKSLPHPLNSPSVRLWKPGVFSVTSRGCFLKRPTGIFRYALLCFLFAVVAGGFFCYTPVISVTDFTENLQASEKVQRQM